MHLSRRTFVAGTLASTLVPATTSAAAKPWIDVHTHVIGGPARQFGQAVEMAVAKMDALGVTKSVVFPPPFPTTGFDYPAYVSELARYPGRFRFLAGGGFLNPLLHTHSDPSSVTPDVRQRFVSIAEKMVQAGALGFGEIAVLHLSLVPKHAFEETTPDHPLLLALAEVAGRNGLVIDLHMDPITSGGDVKTPSFLKTPPNPPRLKGNIEGFERLLAHDRNARIVWAHGGSDFTGNMSPALIGRLMTAHENLFMNLRPLRPGLTTIPLHGLQVRNTLMPVSGIEKGWLELLTRFPGRFVLGSDAFHIAASAPEDSPLRTLARGNEIRLAAIVELLARLPADLATKIAHENATRLYRL